MKNDYIFGPREEVDRFARTKRWEPDGRRSWVRPDGGCVCFLTFEEQFEAIAKGQRVYAVGKISAVGLRRLMKVGAIVVKAT
jgi:hypothetical protein